MEKEELKAYEKILNGVIAVNIGIASLPVERLPMWASFLDAWEKFQRENRDSIARMIQQFG